MADLNGHFDCTCYHPNFLFNQLGMLERCALRHPFYSLSKKPETTVKRYENGDKWLQITPSVKGLATIYDKDILIYCISQIMAKLKEGRLYAFSDARTTARVFLWCAG